MFPVLSHVQVLVFSCEISLVCRLKCPYSCFSSHFCFLVIFALLMFVLSMLFLVAVISFPPRFFYGVFTPCINASTLSWRPASPLPSSFDTYSLSTLVVKFYVSSSVFLFSGRVVELLWSTLRMVPSIWAQIFMPLMRFLLCSLVSSSFLVLLGYFFFHLHIFNGVRFQ